MHKANKIIITDYTDYALFIKDYFNSKRNSDGFSFRQFAKCSGFKSPSYLKLIIDKKRKISEKSLGKFMLGLGLSGDEKKYFVLLVRYNNEQDSSVKSMYFDELLQIQQTKSSTQTHHVFEILKNWYFLAIRELVSHPEFQKDPL